MEWKVYLQNFAPTNKIIKDGNRIVETPKFVGVERTVTINGHSFVCYQSINNNKLLTFAILADKEIDAVDNFLNEFEIMSHRKLGDLAAQLCPTIYRYIINSADVEENKSDGVILCTSVFFEDNIKRILLFNVRPYVTRMQFDLADTLYSPYEKIDTIKESALYAQDLIKDASGIINELKENGDKFKETGEFEIYKYLLQACSDFVKNW